MEHTSLKFLLTSSILLSSCGASAQDSSPNETFMSYQAHVQRGLSFDEEASYQSHAQREKVSKRLEAMEAQSAGSSKSMMETYLKAMQAAAKCNELTLASETIDGETASLVYDRKDTCNGGTVKSGGEKIRMVFENGWKIDENVTVM